MPLPPLDSSAPVILLDMSDDRTLWFVRKEGQMERLDIGNEADKPDPAADEIAERVKVVRRIYQDAAGRMYLLAEDIRDEKSSRSGAGLAVIVGGKIDKILFNQELTCAPATLLPRGIPAALLRRRPASLVADVRSGAGRPIARYGPR